MIPGKLSVHMQKSDIRLLSRPSVKPKTLKLLEEYTGRRALQDMGLGKTLLIRNSEINANDK